MGTSGGPVTKCGQNQGTIWWPTDKVVPKTALFTNQLVVANCQSAAKNFTFTQSVCIAYHLVAHCKNGAKDYVKSNAIQLFLWTICCQKVHWGGCFAKKLLRLWTNFTNSFEWSTGMKTLIFATYDFLVLVIFWSIFMISKIEKWPDPKKLL